MNKKVTLNKLKHGATPDLNVYNTLILHNYLFSTVEDGHKYNTLVAFLTVLTRNYFDI